CPGGGPGGCARQRAAKRLCRRTCNGQRGRHTVTLARAGTNRAGAWLLIGPFLLIFAVFTAYPLLRSVLLALQQTFGPGTTRFVGIANFRFLVSDPLFWTAARNTTVYTLGSVFIQLPLALALALLLNRPGLRGRAIYRTIFFAPALVGVVFVAMIFMVLL